MGEDAKMMPDGQLLPLYQSDQNRSPFAIFSHSFTRSDNSVNESQIIGGKSS